MRCRRESKECYFSATRRKKKGTGDNDDLSDAGSEPIYEIKSGRKRLRTSSGHPQEIYEVEEGDDVPRTPGGSIGRTQPLRRPAAPKQVQYGQDDHEKAEQTVGLLQAAEVHGGHDALKLLYEAATVPGGRKASKESGSRPSLNGVSPVSLPSITSPMMEKVNGSYTIGPMSMYQNDPMWKAQVNTTSAPPETGTPFNQVAYAAALKAWSRFRFVRAGWFTAKEAIDYIQYFYKYLSPLTPVALPGFQSYDSHERLLTQEPMLAITMLLIASRHMKLEGPGATSRPYSIHQKLWAYLSGMIDRVVWGQEQFGGGFCGAGAEPGCDVNPLTRKGLRTLGTVESLVLLTEWHPRAMHFPPDEADEELMIPDEPLQTPDITESNDASRGIGGQRMDAWLEPCWRSDRMCWMLLGISMSLAFEIGVFDQTEWQRHARTNDGQPLSAEELQTYDERRGKVRDLLLVYVTQTSGRLGLTSMLPPNYTKPEDSILWDKPFNQHKSIQETVLHFWLRMASLMREGNQKIFANKTFTRDLIKNGDYQAALERFRIPLQDWRNDFNACASIPKYMRYILEIEYEYCRVYINALALQAVAERCANSHPLQIDPPAELARSAVTTNGVRADIAIAPQTLSKWLGGDRRYMDEVGDAARNLLKIVVDGLYPGEYLRHAPVRTYFRIISVAIMLLKSFSLGASESDVADSLTLMDRTVEALRGCIVDDVHVASRFADLLDTLTQNLKPRLVRIAADGRTGRSRGLSHHGTPDPVQPPLGMANQRLQQHQRQASAGVLPNQQQWSYSASMTPNAMNGTMAPNNPLYGISNDAYDLMGPDNNFSIMPPPSFGLQSPTAKFNQNMTTADGTTMDPYGNSNNFGTDNSMQDWLALPLDPLINMSGVDVNQTMYGPELGGQDMLELLLGSNNGNNFQ